jgi:hypothetical protein
MPIVNAAMTLEGAIIDLSIGMIESARQAMLKAGKQAPAPVRIRALVDTGAFCTHIASSVIPPLGLAPTGSVLVATPSTGTTPAMFDRYDVSVTILHPELARIFDIVPILACEPLADDYQALLGRDLLKSCTFFYNGPDDTFSLAF